MEKTITKTYKPVTGGILSIVCGGCSLFVVFGLIIAILAISYGSGWAWDFRPMRVEFVQSLLILIAVFHVIAGILALIGGIFGIQRLKWGLALGGSIAGVFGFFPVGIAAVVFTAIAKDEFTG